jgi:hypothetical protein
MTDSNPGIGKLQLYTAATDFDFNKEMTPQEKEVVSQESGCAV